MSEAETCVELIDPALKAAGWDVVAEGCVSGYPTPAALWAKPFNHHKPWHDMLHYFIPAVQLGLTATPKRQQNVDTYACFGEPLRPEVCASCNQSPCKCAQRPMQPCNPCNQWPWVCEKELPEACAVGGGRPFVCSPKTKLKITLGDGKERSIQHMTSTSFGSQDGKPIAAAQFSEKLHDNLPQIRQVFAGFQHRLYTPEQTHGLFP